jgi:hypothetical protein
LPHWAAAATVAHATSVQAANAVGTSNFDMVPLFI